MVLAQARKNIHGYQYQNTPVSLSLSLSLFQGLDNQSINQLIILGDDMGACGVPCTSCILYVLHFARHLGAGGGDFPWPANFPEQSHRSPHVFS